MKRVLVFSDTHGSIDAAQRIIAETEDIHCIFHLGDNCRDAEVLQKACGKRVVSVRGNCDYDPSVPLKELVVIEGARILLVHGHQYHVGSSMLYLSLAAQEANASAVCFGHTHRSVIEYENGIMILNPGSISRPRGCAASYALLEIENGYARGHIITADKMPFLQK